MSQLHQAFFVILSTVLAIPIPASAQSTTVNPYPSGLFYRNLKTDYGAVGDGVHDDTAAFQAAAASSDSNYPEQQSYTLPKVVFVPPGTYLVRDTIKWGNGYYDCCLSFRGANQATTIIKLADSTASFGDKATPKPVLSTRGGNQSFRQHISDITVNTGVGNPGAIGVQYVSNNVGAMRNVTIVSGDGTGVTGLDMSPLWPGPSLQKNITVRGFDTGVLVGQSEYGPVFEDISLSGQKVVGFANYGNRIAVRNLTSVNTVPAVQNFSFQPNGALFVLKGAKISGGTPGATAITSSNLNGSDDQIYISNAQVTGYGTALNRNGQTLAKLPVEYYSTAPLRLFSTPAKSLNLPVEEAPDPALDPNMANWVYAMDYATLAELQAAINKPNVSTIYLKGRDRLIASGTLVIPPNVKRLVGFDAFVNSLSEYAKVYSDSNGDTLTLAFNTFSSDPFIIQGLNINFDVASGSQATIQRSVVLRDVETSKFHGLKRRGKLYLDDVSMGTLNVTPGQSVWARQLNIETRGTKINNIGGKVWVLGLKTELAGTLIATTQGGYTEMLGTLSYPVESFNAEQQTEPAILNDNSNVSVMYGTSVYAGGAYYPIQVRQVRNDVTKDLLTSTQNSATTMYVGRPD